MLRPLVRACCACVKSRQNRVSASRTARHSILPIMPTATPAGSHAAPYDLRRRPAHHSAAGVRSPAARPVGLGGTGLGGGATSKALAALARLATLTESSAGALVAFGTRIRVPAKPTRDTASSPELRRSWTNARVGVQCEPLYCLWLAFSNVGPLHRATSLITSRAVALPRLFPTDPLPDTVLPAADRPPCRHPSLLRPRCCPAAILPLRADWCGTGGPTCWLCATVRFMIEEATVTEPRFAPGLPFEGPGDRPSEMRAGAGECPPPPRAGAGEYSVPPRAGDRDADSAPVRRFSRKLRVSTAVNGWSACAPPRPASLASALAESAVGPLTGTVPQCRVGGLGVGRPNTLLIESSL